MLLLAILPVSANAPEELATLRLANQSAQRGELAKARKLYDSVADTTDDPGLVAYNRGRTEFESGNLLAAELWFQRCTEDSEASADRRAKALYNWGICLLTRGSNATVYRTAIVCFRQAADTPGTTSQLRTDALNNLELAKWLWIQARAKETKPPKAGDVPPEAPPEQQQAPPPPPMQEPGGESPGQQRNANGAQVGETVKQPQTAPIETSQKAPGAGSKPVFLDPARTEPLTTEQARQLLKDSTERIARDRRTTARLVAGPDRPHVRDW